MKNLMYSFIVPIYNDGYLVSAFCKEFERVFKNYLKSSFIDNEVELIFINDGSTDNSFDLLQESAKFHKFIKVINLSRNFGQHIAILCGYKHASGSIIGRLNVDMQDPPDQIPVFLDNINKDSDIDMVIGLLDKRTNKISDLITSKIFFLFFNFLQASTIPSNTSPLRVMRKNYVDAIISTNDKTPFLQGLESWAGFNVRYVKTSQDKRCDSHSSYTFLLRLKLAFNAVICYSDKPLKIVTFIGLFISCLSLFGILFLISLKLVQPDIQQGYISTLVIICFFAGFQILVTGLCGIYIGKILVHVQDRPLYLIKDKINF